MISVGIVGGTGYTGVELLRLIAAHPEAELRVITSRGGAGQSVADMFPNLRGVLDAVFTEPDVARLAECDVVFFATPNGTAMQMAPALLERGTRVIDLGADFRIRDLALWSRWYGMEHACPELVAEAAYGLCEFNRDAIRAARLVANPGCYPTCVMLGLGPLLSSGLVDTSHVVVDAVSGASGAGRTPRQHTLLCEANENFHAYGASGHRHHPEIEQAMTMLGAHSPGLTFVPHLVPMTRGMHASIYLRLMGSGLDAQSHFEGFYEGEPFIDVMPAGSHPETRSVRGSNWCRLAVHAGAGPRSLIVLSVIDNLVKGASGQAVQNMNLMFGLEETAGLTALAVLP